MSEWILKETDLKKYPHFDSHISAADAQALAQDPQRVEKHSFYPFILFNESWTRFAPKGVAGKSKTRPIRYAARCDAYIFSYYRHLLAEKYEGELVRLGLGATVLAYRGIKRASDGGGKCNIDFALEAVDAIKAAGNCTVLALDISQFFETLNHDQLKSMWCRLFGVRRLASDHFAVFSAITKYAVVDKLAAYERLGYFGNKTNPKTGLSKPGYLKKYNSMPSQLCNGKRFREAITRSPSAKSVIKKNYKSYGIPQGAAISDLLANLYMLDFDEAVREFVANLSGTYLRYSDDILIVAPTGAVPATVLLAKLTSMLTKCAPGLEFKEAKSCVYEFKNETEGQSFCRILGSQGRNGLEYLGFRYDGKQMYIRDATISGLHRKIARVAKQEAVTHVKRYPDKGSADLVKNFGYEELIKSFGRVEEFQEHSDDYKTWTFWTYARRATRLLGPIGKPIFKQLRGYADWVRLRAIKEIEAAVIRRDKRTKSAALSLTAKSGHP